MAKDTARPRVILDSKEAMRKLEALEDQADKLKQAIKEAGKDGNMADQKKLRGQLKKTNKEIKDMKVKSVDVQRTLNNLSGASLKDLRIAARKLKKEMDGLNRESAAFHAKNQQYKTIKNELRGVGREAKRTGSRFSRAADAFNKYSMGIMAGVAALAGFSMTMRSAANIAMDYEEAVDGLQALTGLAGEELQWLSDKAKETSVATVEGGVRIKQGADDIINAYKLVGSQRPELLKNKEALHDVTQNAIILSEAAKMELSPAAAAVTNTLNQMNMASSESRRVINILAAGSQAGAGDIEYLSKAFEKAGTTASLMDMSTEQLAGSVEAMAPFYKEASMMGNSFDKVLLKLKANQIGYVDGQFNLNAAIEELEQRYAKGETAVKLFGVEHAKMGELLVANKDQVQYYTDAVTGSNKAIEQASINTDNNRAKLAQAQNRFKLIAMEVGERFAPALTFSTNAGTKLIRAIFALIEVFKKYGDLILGATAAIVGYYTAVKISQMWEKRALITKKAITLAESKNLILRNAGAVALRAKILLTQRATIAEKRALVTTKALNKAAKMNPIGLIVSGIAIAIPLLLKLRKAIHGVKVNIDELKKTNEQASQDMGMERMIDRYKELKDKTELTAAEQKEYNELLKELAVLAPESAKELDNLGNVIGLNIEKLEEMSISLRKAHLDNFKEILKDSKLEASKLRLEVKFLKEVINEPTATDKYGSKAILDWQKRIKEASKDLSDYDKEISELEYKIGRLEGIITNPFEKFADILGEIKANSLPELEELKNALQEALVFAPQDDAFVKAVKQQIDRVNAELKKLGTKEGSADYFDMKAFKKMLEDAKKEYGEYEKVKTYLTKEQEQERYGEQLKQGKNYQEFLKRLAGKHRDHTDALIEIYKEFEQKKASNAKTMAERMLAFRKKWGLLTANELFEIERSNMLRLEEWARLSVEERLDVSKQLYAKYFDDIQKMMPEGAGNMMQPVDDFEESPVEAELPELSYEDQMWAESIQGRKELLRQFYEDGVISEQEYQMRITEILREQAGNYKNYYDQVGSQFDGLMQSQLSFYKRKMNQELAMYKGNEEKQDQIRKEYGEKQKDYELTMAYIKYGSALLSAMTMQPWPLAVLAVIAATAMADEQIKTIKSQEFYEGGFTSGAKNDKEAVGVVHANEFVASAEAVRNPTLKPFFDEIDLAQKNGSVAAIDFSNVASAMSMRNGFASGGYAPKNKQSEPATQPTSNNQQPIAILDKSSIQLLARTLAQTERKIIFTPESIKTFTEAQDEIIKIQQS